MSFLFHPNASDYCDWRISIGNNCKNSHIYQAFLITGATLCSLCIVLGLGSLFLRKAASEASWKGLVRGVNLAFLFFFINPFLFATQALLVLFNANHLLNAIIWSMMIPFSVMSNLIYFSNLVKILPSSIMLTTNTLNGKWYPTDSQRNTFLFLFYFYMAVSQVILISLAEWAVLKGDLLLSSRLLKSGLSLGASNLIVYSFCFLAVIISLVRRLQTLLEESKGAQSPTSGFETVNLSTTLAKLKQTLYICFFASIQIPSLYFPMAFYQEFFSNQACSIAFSFIFMVLVPFNTVLTFALYLVVDIQKALKKKVSVNSHSVSSKKGEKGSQSHPAEKWIEELRQP